MPINVSVKPMVDKLRELEDFAHHELPEVVGIAAVNEFNENFDRQSFDGVPWPEVERRKRNSKWFAFKEGSRVSPPDNHPKRKGTQQPYKARKANPITNYSPTAARTPILSSQESNLENSLHYIVSAGRVVVKSDLPYAAVHNEGKRIRVFGKKSVKVKARRFAGWTKELQAAIEQEVEYRLEQRGI